MLSQVYNNILLFTRINKKIITICYLLYIRSMAKRFETVDEALNYCFERIRPSIVGDDYNRLSVMRNRYKNGNLKQKGIKYVLDYFKIKDHCYYTVEEE